MEWKWRRHCQQQQSAITFVMEEIIVNNQLSRWRLGTFCSSEIKFFDKFSKLLHEMVIIMACLKHFLMLYLFACVLGIVNGQ